MPVLDLNQFLEYFKNKNLCELKILILRKILKIKTILRKILRINVILRIRIFVNRKILILRIFLRKMTILRKILRIRFFVNTDPGPVFTKILRIYLRITLKSKKNSLLGIFLFLE